MLDSLRAENFLFADLHGFSFGFLLFISCFSSSGHVVGRLHHGRDVDGKNPLPWDRPYEHGTQTHSLTHMTLILQTFFALYSRQEVVTCIRRRLDPLLFSIDIDQLTRIMKLVGTPDDALLDRLLSEEVRSAIFSKHSLTSGHDKAIVVDQRNLET